MSDDAHRAMHVNFWKKFLRLTRGRIPVVAALDIIHTETRDTTFRDVVAALRAHVNEGSPLSESLAERPECFSASVVALIRSAEKTGAWDEILEEVIGGLADGTFE